MASIKELLPENYTQKIRLGMQKRLAVHGDQLSRSEAGALAVHDILDNHLRQLVRRPWIVRRELRSRAEESWAAGRIERVEDNRHYQSAGEKLGFVDTRD